MERQLERESARARPRIEAASRNDPEWARRAEAAWKRLSSDQDSREAAKAFEDILREKGLL